MIGGADKGEVLDLVARKEPVSLRDIMGQQSVYSEDEVFDMLQSLIETGEVGRRAGELDRDGTTRDVYYVTEDFR